jgi:ankyrin repeat protein
VAAGKGHLEMIRILLEHGADVNHQGPSHITALGSAASAGELAAAKLLLARGAKVDPPGKDDTPLEWAVWGRHAEMTRLLLAQGADPNRQSPGSVFASILGEAILKIPDVAPDLLAHGADVNAGHGEPLLAALYSHRPALVQELLKRGARVRFYYIDTKYRFSGEPLPYVPLTIAARYAPECMEMLLQAGADINAADLSGETALTQAILYAPMKVKWLLEHGADIHVVTRSQRTPLDLAAAQGSRENVRLLLALGADLYAHPTRGHSALYWARKHLHTEVVQLLQEAGAPDE